MKDRLIELLKDGHSLYIRHISGKTMYEDIADYIIADGWIRPPCKVGDTLYVPKYGSNEIVECEVTQVRIIYSKHKGKTIQIYFNSGNKLTEAFFTPIDFEYGFVFLTRKEAEKALKRKEDEKR